MSRINSGLGQFSARRALVMALAYHVIHNGQSLSVGTNQNPVSLTQTRGHLKLLDSANVWSLTYPTALTLSLVPLVAPQRPVQTTIQGWPNNIGASTIGGETAEIGFANSLTDMLALRLLGGLKIVASCVGQAGAAMNVINKGGSGVSYAAAQLECAAARQLLSGGGSSALNPAKFSALCQLFTHGETDSANIYLGTQTAAAYQAALILLQQNDATDRSAITGQSLSTQPWGVPLVLTQQHSNPGALCGLNGTSLAMFNAAQLNPTTILMAGGKYHMFNANGDAQHLGEYRHLGAMYARVMDVVMNGLTWAPTWPIASSRSANVVTITWHTPVAPLVLDNGSIPPPNVTTWGQTHTSGPFASFWANAYGCEAWDNQLQIIGTSGNGASPIVYQTATPHGLGVGSTATFAAEGILGNTAANQVALATGVDSTHFSMPGTGNGAFATSPAAIAFQPIQITAVNLAANGHDTVLTLSRTPLGGTGMPNGVAAYFAYAAHIAQTFGVGPLGPQARRGLIRDSDRNPLVALYGSPYNWGVEVPQYAVA